MTKADQELACLFIYHLSGDRGQNILDKEKFAEAN